MAVTPLPTPPSTSDPANFDARGDAFLGALPLYGSELNDTAAMVNAGGTDTLGWRNMLLNPDFRLNQRGLASLADDTYGPDRWYALTQTGAIAYSVLSAPEEDGSGYSQGFAVRLTQSQASAQRFGIAQIVEADQGYRLRSKKVTLSGRVRCSAATTIRYAVLNWRGVADTVTSDIVNDWTSAVYDEAGFFIANARPLTNLLGAVATGSVAVAAGAWTALAPLSGTVSSTGSNLIVVIWTESTQAQNVTLDIGEAQLERGIVRTPFEKRPLALELAMCQRFYEKSFPLDIAPAQNAGVDGMMTFSQGVAASTGQGGMFFPFKVAKRIAPTVVTYNPLAASAQIRNNTTSSNWTATTATGRHGGLQVSGTSPAGTALGDTASMHWSADAEL